MTNRKKTRRRKIKRRIRIPQTSIKVPTIYAKGVVDFFKGLFNKAPKKPSVISGPTNIQPALSNQGHQVFRDEYNKADNSNANDNYEAEQKLMDARHNIRNLLSTTTTTTGKGIRRRRFRRARR